MRSIFSFRCFTAISLSFSIVFIYYYFSLTKNSDFGLFVNFNYDSPKVLYSRCSCKSQLILIEEKFDYYEIKVKENDTELYHAEKIYKFSKNNLTNMQFTCNLYDTFRRGWYSFILIEKIK
jgi:hypothetical protein